MNWWKKVNIAPKSVWPNNSPRFPRMICLCIVICKHFFFTFNKKTNTSLVDATSFSILHKNTVIFNLERDNHAMDIFLTDSVRLNICELKQLYYCYGSCVEVELKRKMPQWQNSLWSTCCQQFLLQLAGAT